ncbi:MAG: hypothetical protein QXU20_01825 [Candidatus Woesearchaeota archaeon]
MREKYKKEFKEDDVGLYIISIYSTNDSCKNQKLSRKSFEKIYKSLESRLSSKNKEYKIKSFENINSFYILLKESDLENFIKELDDCIRNFDKSNNLEYKIEKSSTFTLF